MGHDIYNTSGGAILDGACPDQTGIYGNISADPMFTSAASGDFHLRTGSPAIDTGNTSSPQLTIHDLDNNARVLDASGKGYPVVDMGAYEAAGIGSPSPTILTLTPSTYYPYSGFPYGNSNAPFTLTANAKSALGLATGPVTFYEDMAAIGTLNLDLTGSITLQVPRMTPGVHAFLATYPGEGGFTAAVSVKFFVFVPKYGTTLTLTSSPNPSLAAGAVTFTVTSASDDGSVPSPIVLAENSTVLVTLTPDSSGKATYTTSSLSVGFHSITASYAGDAAHNSASASVSQLVQNPDATSIAVSSSANPSIVGQQVTFTAKVTSLGGAVPTGNVVMQEGSTVVASQVLDTYGSASLSTSSLTTGFHRLEFIYQPTGAFETSQTALYQTVQSGYSTNVSVRSSLNPSNVGQSVTFTARVTSNNGTPTGSITFTDGGNNLGSQNLDASGAASISTAALTRGVHTIVATYMPAGTFAGSTGQLVQQVTGLSTTSSLTATPVNATVGDTIQLTATVTSSSSGAITGTVTFLADGSPISAPVALSAGSASFSTSSLRPGSHSLSCSYSGDDSFAPSNCAPVSITVNNVQTAVTLTSSANPALALDPVIFTANLTGGGKPYQNTVLFYVDGKPARSAGADANGIAALTISLPAGAHTVNAQFPGNDGYSGSSASISETVNANSTVTTLAATPNPVYQNQPLNVSATVRAMTGSAQPYGAVAVYEGSTQLANLTIAAAQSSPTASFSIATLPPGTHLLTAVYTPSDGNFLGNITAAPLSVTVLPQGFTFTVDKPSITLQTEHHAAITLMLKSFGGFAGNIRLACGSPLPVEVTCELPSAMRLKSDDSVPVSLIIDTDAVLNFKSETAPARKPGTLLAGAENLAWATVLPLALFGLRRRRNVVRWLVCLILFVGSLCGLAGCGSKYPAHTPPGTYDVTVTATGAPDGNTVAVSAQTLHLALVVTP